MGDIAVPTRPSPSEALSLPLNGLRQLSHDLGIIRAIAVYTSLNGGYLSTVDLRQLERALGPAGRTDPPGGRADPGARLAHRRGAAASAMADHPRGTGKLPAVVAADPVAAVAGDRHLAGGAGRGRRAPGASARSQRGDHRRRGDAGGAGARQEPARQRADHGRPAVAVFCWCWCSAWCSSTSPAAPFAAAPRCAPRASSWRA